MAFFLAKASFVTMDGSLFSVGQCFGEVPCSRTKVANILLLAFPFLSPFVMVLAIDLLLDFRDPNILHPSIMNKKNSDVVGFIVERFRNNWSLEVTNPIVAV